MDFVPDLVKNIKFRPSKKTIDRLGHVGHDRYYKFFFLPHRNKLAIDFGIGLSYLKKMDLALLVRSNHERFVQSLVEGAELEVSSGFKPVESLRYLVEIHHELRYSGSGVLIASAYTENYFGERVSEGQYQFIKPPQFFVDTFVRRGKVLGKPK